MAGPARDGTPWNFQVMAVPQLCRWWVGGLDLGASLSAVALAGVAKEGCDGAIAGSGEGFAWTIGNGLPWRDERRRSGQQCRSY
jgi:hypothetical protein